MLIVPFKTVKTSVKDFVHTIAVEVNCPHCLERTGYDGLIKFVATASAMGEKVMFERQDCCPNCAVNFVGGIHPGMKTLCQWKQREKMLESKEIQDCYYEEVHRYIPEGSRSSEKKSRKRKDVKIVKGFGNYLMEGA